MAFKKGDYMSASEYNAHIKDIETIDNTQSHEDLFFVDTPYESEEEVYIKNSSAVYNTTFYFRQNGGVTFGNLSNWQMEVLDSTNNVLVHWDIGRLETSQSVLPPYPYRFRGTEEEGMGSIGYYDWPYGVYLDLKLPLSETPYTFKFKYTDVGLGQSGKYKFGYQAKQIKDVGEGQVIKLWDEHYNNFISGPITRERAFEGRLGGEDA
jgi:hypothetical protein